MHNAGQCGRIRIEAMVRRRRDPGKQDDGPGGGGTCTGYDNDQAKLLK